MRNINFFEKRRKIYINGHRLKAITSLLLILALFILYGLDSGYSEASTLPIKMKFIAGGSEFSASIGVDGSVWTWGDNYAGQLGDGSKISRSIPAKVKGLSGFKAVACGANHTLALKEDGTVWAWGHNLCKQIGNGTKNGTQSSPVKVTGLNNIKAIAGGYNHSVALKSDGTVWTWGRGCEGQLGRETSDVYTANPGVIKSLDNVTAIAALSDYTAALKHDGTVWVCGESGSDTMTQAEGLTDITAISAMANNVAALKSDGTVFLWKFTAYGGELTKIEGLEDIKSISGGQYNFTALKKDGSLLTVGEVYTVSGVLIGADPDFVNVTRINDIDNVKTIASGYNHTLVLKNDGTVWGIGNNRAGQLGNGIIAYSSNPSSIPGLNKIKDIKVSAGQSMALNDKGVVFVWGENVSKFFASVEYEYISTPKEVPDITDVKALACNFGTYAVLKEDGTIFGWGVNTDNIKKMDGLNKVIAIDGGYNLNCQYIALKSDGTVWEWLLNGNVDKPHKVNGISNVTAISKGTYHSLALKKDGTVWSWRNPEYYADESKIDTKGPLKINGLSNVVAISAGEKTSLALKKDDSVWIWETDYKGNLARKPQKINGLSDVIAISGDSTALKKDGTVWTWVNNQYVKLSNGTFINKITPAKVLGLKNIVRLSSSQLHTLALDKNGTVWAWGLNDNGQLGNGIALFEDKFVQCLIE